MSHRPIAEALLHAPPGRLIVDGEYHAFSSVFFYTNRQGLLLNGRVNDLEYGSYARHAAPVFIDDTGEIVIATQPETVNQETGEQVPAIEIIAVNGDWAVKEAAKFWNISEKDAAIAVQKKWHGKMDKREFLDVLKNSEKRTQEAIVKELGF